MWRIWLVNMPIQLEYVYVGITWYWLCCSTKCLGPVCSKYSILWWLQYKESYVHQWYKHLRHSLLIFKTIMHITIQQTSQGLSITFISRDNSASASSGLFSAYCERWGSYWEKNVEWRSAFIFFNGVFTIAKIDIAYLVHVNIKEINNPWNTVVLSHNLPSLSWDLLIEGDKIHELGLVTIKKSDKIHAHRHIGTMIMFLRPPFCTWPAWRGIRPRGVSSVCSSRTESAPGWTSVKILPLVMRAILFWR